MERIRQIQAAIISGENTKDKEFDEFHIVYFNKDLILRNKYDISKDPKMKYQRIFDCYNKFIKEILEYEIDKKDLK